MTQVFANFVIRWALHNIDQLNECSACFSICSASSDLCAGLLCSDQQVVMGSNESSNITLSSLTFTNTISCILGAIFCLSD